MTIDEIYSDLVRTVLDEGDVKRNRTGIDTLSYFDYHYRYDLAHGFPLLTTKKMHLKSIFGELCWFLRGRTDVEFLHERGITIWDEWVDKNGYIPAGYGRFWRAFPYFDLEAPRYFDQLAWVIAEIKRNPDSRRLVVSAWSPADATASKIPPCHYTFCFNVTDGRLNCHMTQRSADIGLGVPFNIASYAALIHVVANECGLIPGILGHTMVDAHIYSNHIKALSDQICRLPRGIPTLKVNKLPFEQLDWDDFVVTGYDPHPGIKMEVAV